MTGSTDLNALILFYEAANAGSISAAAAKLEIPKSTISRKIAMLEAQVGATLLRRGARSSSLTEIGAAIFDHAQRIIAELEEAGIHATEMQTKLSGILRISLPVDFGVSWLSRMIADFSRHHPEMRLALDINNRWVDVVEEPYDIAIQLSPPRNTDLPVRRFSSLSRRIYVCPDYLDGRDPPDTLSSLADLDLVTTTHQTEEDLWRKIFDQDETQGTRRGKLPPPRVLVNNISIARELVVAGMGIGVLPDVMCKNDICSGRLIHLFPEWEAPRIQAYVSYLGRRRVPAKTKAFMTFLSSYLLTSREYSTIGPAKGERKADARERSQRRKADSTRQKVP